LTERGINALGLYIAAQTATDIAPDTMGCIREYPKTELQFDQPVPQGTYWSSLGHWLVKLKLGLRIFPNTPHCVWCDISCRLRRNVKPERVDTPLCHVVAAV